MAIAGGIRGAPVELAPCETIDLPYIADAEIVLEAEILPTGWTWPEGRFGEFTRLMGGLHWNPLVRIKAISMRKDAIYYNLHMPWENTWLAAPTRYAAIRPALQTAGVQVKDINVTLGGCAFWHAVISIKKQPGEAKNALLAALSVMDLKHVVVVDDDIDVFDPTDVEWAIATRVQGDKDVMIVGNARAKPLDPSLPQGFGVVPTGAKVGIDATIPEGIPREHYERITYAYADTAKIDDYVERQEGRCRPAPATTPRSRRSRRRSWRRSRRQPLYYTDIAERFATLQFPHRRARDRPSACDRKAVAGSARPHVRARLAVRRQAAGEVRASQCFEVVTVQMSAVDMPYSIGLMLSEPHPARRARWASAKHCGRPILRDARLSAGSSGRGRRSARRICPPRLPQDRSSHLPCAGTACIRQQHPRPAARPARSPSSFPTRPAPASTSWRARSATSCRRNGASRSWSTTRPARAATSATGFAARAAPDGNTLLMIAKVFVVNPSRIQERAV